MMSYPYRICSTVIFCSLILVSLSFDAHAHVKWFAPYDVVAPPRDLATVLTPVFWLIGLLSVACVFVLSLIERLNIGVRLAEQVDHYRALIKASAPERVGFRIIRYTLLIFFTCVWTLGNVILTPELTYEDSILVGTIHLVIMLSLFSERGARFAGAGIICLWVYSAVYYGFFHLSDYTIFLGLAVFLIMASQCTEASINKGFLLLYCAISITLQWASIEKFVYPEWSFPLLTERPYLTMGLGNEAFMIMAGFVEFAFAFLLIAVSGISFIIVTVSLAIIFILAIFDFGKIDAIGHLAIIVSLFVMALQGPAKINLRLSQLHARPVVNALLVSLLYCVSVIIFFVLYYGIRILWISTSGAH